MTLFLKNSILRPATCYACIACVVIGLPNAQGAPQAVPAVTTRPASNPTDSVNILEPEIRIPRKLNPATEPILVRFLIQNTSANTVDLGPIPVSDGISLPLSIILGAADSPALFIGYEDEDPVPVKGPLPEAAVAVGESRPLLVAANGTVGTRIDLRDVFKNIRYPGLYRIEWRPLGDTIGTAVASLRVEPRKQAIIVTDYGNITFDLTYEQAPANVDNFLDLVRSHFYRDTTFHRVIPGFAIQGGCPLGNGTGVRSDGKLFPAELHDAEFKLGTLAMSHKPSDPNSASCQFFIALARLPELDGHYTVIGQAADEESLRTLRQIASVATDEHNRPTRPLGIRSINLIDAEDTLAYRKAAGRK